MHASQAWNQAVATEIIARHSTGRGTLLPLLHDLQDAFGHVPEAAVPLVAHALNLSRAEVHGVISFYHDYRRTPPGAHIVKLCQAEACQSMGSRRLARHVEERLGIALGETTADGRITAEAVYCLGLCATAPAALIDGQPAGRVSPARIDALLAELA